MKTTIIKEKQHTNWQKPRNNETKEKLKVSVIEQFLCFLCFMHFCCCFVRCFVGRSTCNLWDLGAHLGSCGFGSALGENISGQWLTKHWSECNEKRPLSVSLSSPCWLQHCCAFQQQAFSPTGRLLRACWNRMNPAPVNSVVLHSADRQQAVTLQSRPTHKPPMLCSCVRGKTGRVRGESLNMLKCSDLSLLYSAVNAKAYVASIPPSTHTRTHTHAQRGHMVRRVFCRSCWHRLLINACQVWRCVFLK